MIIAKNVHKNYGEVNILKGVNLHIKKGEVVAIVGPSGAGKTTLLQILGTLDRPSNYNYKLTINNKNVDGLSDEAISTFRNEHIGFIFQFHQLLPEFTALENVCIPAFIANKSKESTEKRAKELLEFLGLSHRIHHKPNEMSGGEQQRVAVARALINEPSVIFADEPSGNLDSTSAKNLHELFFKLRDEFGQTFVLITHNKDLAEMADRTLEMKDGVINNGNQTLKEDPIYLTPNKQNKKNSILGIIFFISMTSGGLTLMQPNKSTFITIIAVIFILIALFTVLYYLLKRKKTIK